MREREIGYLGALDFQWFDNLLFFIFFLCTYFSNNFLNYFELFVKTPLNPYYFIILIKALI